MTNEERDGIFTAIGAMLASQRQIEIKIDAAIDALEQTESAFHLEYQKALASKRTNVVNDLSKALEYLRKTLPKNTL